MSRNLPNPRLASRLLMQRSDDDIDENLSLLVMGFGQFLDHDMMLTPSRKPTQRDCCSRQHRHTEDCCPIEVSYTAFQKSLTTCFYMHAIKLTEYSKRRFQI